MTNAVKKIELSNEFKQAIQSDGMQEYAELLEIFARDELHLIKSQVKEYPGISDNDALEIAEFTALQKFVEFCEEIEKRELPIYQNIGLTDEQMERALKRTILEKANEKVEMRRHLDAGEELVVETVDHPQGYDGKGMRLVWKKKDGAPKA